MGYTIHEKSYFPGGRMLYLLFVILFILIESYLKNYVETHFSSKHHKLILRDKILLRKYHNEGAFLNMMEKKKKLLHAISIFFTFLIAFYFILTLFQRGNKILKAGLTLLLGGAFSNTYDRLTKSYVVDYFSFRTPFPAINNIVFNLSDFCIIIGAMLTILHSK